MADRRISDLPALSAAAAGDLLVVVDVDDLSQSPQGTTKKATVALLGVGPHTHVAADITDLAGLLAAKQDAATAATDAELDAHVTDPTAAHAASAISYVGGPGMSATDVEAAIDELATEKQDAATAATDAELTSHASVTESVHGLPNAAPLEALRRNAADTAWEGFDAATQAELDAHLTDAVDAHDASAVSYAGGQGLAATDVEGAIDELAIVTKINESVGRDIALTDMNACIAVGASSQTFTIPDPVISGVTNGSWFEIRCDVAGPTTITHAGGAKIFDPFTGGAVTSVVIPATTAQGKFATYRFTNTSTGSNQWIVSHDNKIPNDIVNAKGDLIVGTAADTVARKPVGTNYYRFAADSAAADGLKWAKEYIYNIEDRGAVSGGSASVNRTAFNDTVTAMPSTGALLVIPDGTFDMDQALTITKSGIWVLMIGTLNFTTGSLAHAISWGTGASQGNEGGLFGGGTIECNRNTTQAINVDGWRNLTVSDVEVKDPVEAVVNVVSTGSAIDCDTHFFSHIRLSSDNTFNQSQNAFRPTRFFRFDGTGTGRVTDCWVDACSAIGGLEPTSYNGTTDPQTGAIGIEIKNADRISIRDCRVYSHVRRAVGGTSLGTCTMTIASPCVVTNTGHGLANDDPLYFTTTGALPTGLSTRVQYFARNVTANTFEVSATAGGASINTSGTQSGTHTLLDGGGNACYSKVLYIHATSGKTASGNKIENLYAEATPSGGVNTDTNWIFHYSHLLAEAGGTVENNIIESENMSCSASAANRRIFVIANSGTSVKYNQFIKPKDVATNSAQYNIGSGCQYTLLETLLPNEPYINSGGLTNAIMPLTVPKLIGLVDKITDTNTSGTAETDLFTYTVPAGRLVEDGDKLELWAYLRLVSHATANRTFGVYFAGTQILAPATWQNTASDNGVWIEVRILRITNTSCRFIVRATRSVEAVTSTTAANWQNSGTISASLDFTTAEIIKVTGTTDVGAALVTARGGNVIFIPAAV